MKQTDLDRFYTTRAGYLDVVASYLDDRRIAFILRACRCRPESMLHKALPPSVKLVNWWIDEHSNSIIISKNKFKLLLNDIRIERLKLNCTDLYANLNIQNLSQISKLLYVIVYGDDYVISFLGKDNYLRSKIYIDKVWSNIPSLYLGIDALNSIADSLDIKYFNDVKNTKILPIDAELYYSWISGWPPHKHFINKLNDNCPQLINYLNVYGL